MEGIPEVRYSHDCCMPAVGAREIWNRFAPERKTAASAGGLIRAVTAGAAQIGAAWRAGEVGRPQGEPMARHVLASLS